MSSRDVRFRIQDILKAISKIELYLSRMTLREFRDNDLVADAIIRNFEIIGEASKNVPLAIRRSNPEIPWKQMNDMRNILIHEYFGIDFDVVWHTARTHLPHLKLQLERLLVSLQ